MVFVFSSWLLIGISAFIWGIAFVDIFITFRLSKITNAVNQRPADPLHNGQRGVRCLSVAKVILSMLLQLP